MNPAIKKTSISLPERLWDAAEKRAEQLGHTSLSGYLQDLIRRDAERHRLLDSVDRIAEPADQFAGQDISSVRAAPGARGTAAVESTLRKIEREVERHAEELKARRAKKKLQQH